MEDLEIFGIPYLAKGSGIHIKKENRKLYSYIAGIGRVKKFFVITKLPILIKLIY